MKTPSRATLLATALILGAASAPAASLTVNVAGDANIRASGSGYSQIALVGDTTTANDYLRGVFSFNLNDPLLVGATINSVTLKLYINGDDTASLSSVETLQVFQLAQAFNETQVTWTQAQSGTPWSTPGGDFSSTLLSSVTANPHQDSTAPNQELLFASSADFVASVASTLLQSDKTIGLLVKLAVEDNNRSIFRISTGTTTGNQSVLAEAQYRPQLVIDYTPSSIPEPSAFSALAGIGALGFVASRRRRR